MGYHYWKVCEYLHTQKTVVLTVEKEMVGQVALLKSVPLRLYANTLIFTKATYDFLLDSMRVSDLELKLLSCSTFLAWNSFD